MDHLDPDHLTAFALDPESNEERSNEHLSSCPRCRSELRTMREVTARARSAGRPDPISVPPGHVWDNIVRELTASGDLGSGDFGSGDLGANDRSPRPARRTVRWQPFALAAALVLLVVMAAGVLLPATNDIVATAALEPLAQVSGARAELVSDGDQRTLTIADLDLPPIDGYYELWLLGNDDDGMVSLGPITGQEQVAVPPAVDTTRFAVVDISREPSDGDPTHSTDSVLRGPLEPRA